jgi:hypothetical protein
MSFTVHVRRERWYEHQDSVWAAVTRASGTTPVPVIKGNGYGLGQETLTEQAVRLDADTVAVGTVWEVEAAASRGNHDIVVLQPFDPLDTTAAEEWWRIGERLHAGRVIRTIASPEALLTLCDGPGSVRVILEGRSSVQRFGMVESQLLELLADTRVRHALERARILIEGLSIHLPMVQPKGAKPLPGVVGTPRVHEVVRWAGLWHAQTLVWTGHNSPASTVWVSHLNDDEVALVVSSVPDIVLRVRVGTRLWLGDRGALQAYGTVLAAHTVKENTPAGYRQRTGPSDATLLVIGGGTAHGVGLSAPTPATRMRQRLVTVGTGALAAVSRSLSPFTWAGKQRWFAEPPHQHVSLVWIPWGSDMPAVGDLIPAEVRYTTSRFDAVIFTD